MKLDRRTFITQSGVSTAALAWVATAGHELHSFMMARQGYVVAEGW